MFSIAKREKNLKRKYLIVNRFQGKHIPVRPSQAFGMFDKLAAIVTKAYSDEALLFIGFAETATAIGAALAVHLNAWYMQTTREQIEDVEYLHFSESHSHATEQKLVKTDLDWVIPKVDRVIFVEDEVTTGNTILNIINLMQKYYGKSLQFAVASLLNGMDAEACRRYQNRGISLQYLIKIHSENYTEIAERYQGNGAYFDCTAAKTEKIFQFCAKGYINARRLTRGDKYLRACKCLWEQIRLEGIVSADSGIASQQNILVLGTEEFMYPALFIARQLEQIGYAVKSHSTTRSPILVSQEEEYPLHRRYELVSVYDKDRRTFIYDICKYDKVLILTDACVTDAGRNSLLHALAVCGNHNIYWVRWCEYEKFL